MTEAPEKTWVTFVDDSVPWSGVAYERKTNADAVEYIRADLFAALMAGIADLRHALARMNANDPALVNEVEALRSDLRHGADR